MMLKLGVRDVTERLAKNKVDFVRLFERDAFDVGMYKPEKVDGQKPHMRDEIYVIATGSGEFVVQDERQPFIQGDVLFVPERRTSVRQFHERFLNMGDFHWSASDLRQDHQIKTAVARHKVVPRGDGSWQSAST